MPSLFIIHSKCQYCMKTYNNHDAVVRHCILDHPAKNVSFLWPLRNASGKKRKFSAVGVDYRTPMREALGSRHNSTMQVVFMNL